MTASDNSASDAHASDTGSSALVTAAILVIGDEILSGRTKDRNIGHIAETLTGVGIDLREVRVVPDEEAEIVAALNAMRARYSYVFTTGGIGPTHDDITADSVAKAFGVPIEENARAIELLLQRIKPADLNAARRRMARIPIGADLVENTVSKAPGFWIGNVIVMAGVPSVMQAMLESVLPKLSTGARQLMETIEAEDLPEGAYASSLGVVAAAHLGRATIGSYPSYADGKFRNRIVVRARSIADLEAVTNEVRSMLAALREARVSV